LTHDPVQFAMPRGATNLPQLLLDIAQSMNNVGYQNDQFVPFVQFLLTGRQLRASYLSAQTPPGQVQVALDLMFVCGQAQGSVLISVTARRTGVVDWSILSLRSCSAVGVSTAAGLAVATLNFGASGTIQIAAPRTEEGDLNSFAIDVSRAAWGQ
jgi:hypothetical protein